MTALGRRWWLFHDDNGAPYFYNEVTKETQWERPIDLGNETPDDIIPPPPPEEESGSRSKRRHKGKEKERSERDKDASLSSSRSKMTTSRRPAPRQRSPRGDHRREGAPRAKSKSSSEVRELKESKRAKSRERDNGIFVDLSPRRKETAVGNAHGSSSSSSSTANSTRRRAHGRHRHDRRGQRRPSDLALELRKAEAMDRGTLNADVSEVARYLAEHGADLPPPPPADPDDAEFATVEKLEEDDDDDDDDDDADDSCSSGSNSAATRSGSSYSTAELPTVNVEARFVSEPLLHSNGALTSPRRSSLSSANLSPRGNASTPSSPQLTRAAVPRVALNSRPASGPNLLNEASGAAPDMHRPASGPDLLSEPAAPDLALLTPRSRQRASTIAAPDGLQITRADASNAFASKRAAQRSAYTLAIVKPGDVSEKNEQTQNYYRHMTLGELLDTELEYNEQLAFIVQHFYEPLRESQLLTPDDVAKIFRNVTQLRDESSGFVRALQERLRLPQPLLAPATPNAECVGAVFLAHLQRFTDAFPDYCVGHERARSHLAVLVEADPRAAERVQALARAAELKSLDAYLIKPVQRVTKYPLLLAELLRYTPAAHPDYEALELARHKLRDLVAAINRRKKTEEGRLRWLNTHESLEIDGNFDLGGHDRALLLQGDFASGELDESGKLTRVSTRRFWLCDDVLLCGSKARLAARYKVDGVFRLLPDAAAAMQYAGAPLKDKEFATCFQVVSFARHTPSMVIACPTAHVRDLWLTELQACLRDAFERQRARTARQLGAERADTGDARRAAADTSTAQFDAMSASERDALNDDAMRAHLASAFGALVASETEYVEQLHLCTRGFLAPLQQSVRVPTELARFFGALRGICDLHSQRLLPLVAAVNPNQPGDDEAALQCAVSGAVDLLALHFDGYMRHARHADPASALFERSSRPGSEFHNCVQQLRAVASQQSTAELAELLMVPLARIGALATAVERVALCSRGARAEAEAWHASGVCQQLLKAQQRAAAHTRLKLISLRLHGVPDAKPLVAPERVFLFESDLRINGKPYHAWLFSDRLLYASAKAKGMFHYKGEFDLANQTLIRNVIDTKAVSNAFELVRIADQTSATCVTTGPAAKRFWMASISSAIKDNMREAMRRRKAAAGEPNKRRVCEYCNAAPPVAKVVYKDGSGSIRACERCTHLLNKSGEVPPSPASPAMPHDTPPPDVQQPLVRRASGGLGDVRAQLTASAPPLRTGPPRSVSSFVLSRPTAPRLGAGGALVAPPRATNPRRGRAPASPPASPGRRRPSLAMSDPTAIDRASHQQITTDAPPRVAPAPPLPPMSVRAGSAEDGAPAPPPPPPRNADDDTDDDSEQSPPPPPPRIADK